MAIPQALPAKVLLRPAPAPPQWLHPRSGPAPFLLSQVHYKHSTKDKHKHQNCPQSHHLCEPHFSPFLNLGPRSPTQKQTCSCGQNVPIQHLSSGITMRTFPHHCSIFPCPLLAWSCQCPLHRVFLLHPALPHMDICHLALLLSGFNSLSDGHMSLGMYFTE